ncbi:MAG: C39 family peptidase [Desulfobacula sp.]|nr:C39 family peptidase [Desulfobacula sp.]
MNILAALIIFTGIFSQFFLMTDFPENELDIVTGPQQTAAIKSQVTSQEIFSAKGITKQAHDFSCGSAALATLLNGQFGEQFTEKQVIRGLLEYGDAKKIAKRRAFSLLDMKRFAQKIGYDGNGYKAGMEDLTQLGQPGILPIKMFNYRHFVVFKGITKGHVFLADPWRGNISFTMGEFERSWYKHVIFLLSDTGDASWGRLSLTENDLRLIDEDEVRDLMSEQLRQIQLTDRSINNGPGAMNVYKR